MVVTLSYLVVAAATAWGLLAAWLAWRDRLINDPLLLLAVLVEVGLIALAIVALTTFGRVDPAAEGATYLAYALSLPTVPPLVTLLAIREKTRWSVGACVLGAFAVAVMAARIAQIWNLHG
ncbi:MAG: hypothetical protein V9G19_27265 [Tetrasphaera sp.]